MVWSTSGEIIGNVFALVLTPFLFISPLIVYNCIFKLKKRKKLQYSELTEGLKKDKES